MIDIRDMLKTVPVDIPGIAETKLDDTFTNAQFNIDGYRLFRKDRNQHGGGLLVYVRADIPCRQIRTLETKSTESVTLELQLNKTKCLIVVAYKPPNVTSHACTLDMTNLLDRATRHYSDIWVIGDLNFDLLDRTKSETLRDVCDIYGLDQLIKEPTNTTIHGSSLIDVILTTVPTKTSSSGSTNVGLSDTHNMRTDRGIAARMCYYDWSRTGSGHLTIASMSELCLSKAFDCLPHQLLVAKLRAYGACDRSCALIWSYLSGRRQRVRIGCSTSDWLPLTKGVPRAPSWHQYFLISSSTTYMQPSQSRPSTTMPTIIPYLHAAIPSN